MTSTAYQIGTMGQGVALHLIDDKGVVCNRWGTTNGTWKAPKISATATEATCRKCLRIAAKEA